MAPKDPNGTSRGTSSRQQKGPAGNDEVVKIDLSRVPAHVHSVTFSGLSSRTKDDLLIQVAKDILLRQKDGIKSFDQLIQRSNLLREQLQHGMNGCFKHVSITIDSVASSSRDGHEDDDEDNVDNGSEYIVHVSVKESNRITGSVMTTTSGSGAGAGSMSSPAIETSIRLNNVHGRGESLSLAYLSRSLASAAGGGSESASSIPAGFSLTASKPLVHSRKPLVRLFNRIFGKDDAEVELDEEDSMFRFKAIYPVMTATFFDSESSFPLSGFRQRERGFLLDHFSFITSRLTSRIRFQSDWRSMTSASAADGSIMTPIEIRERCGHYLKSSIRHAFMFDDRSYGWGFGGRNVSYFPCSGSLAEISTEFAGIRVNGTQVLPGNESFVKQELHLQLNERIPGTRFLIQACFRAGIIFDPFSQQQGQQQQSQKSVAMSEKFFVGGPMTMRGFSHYGVGPSIGSNNNGGHRFAFGSDAYWNAGLHAYAPLPFVRRSKVSSSSSSASASMTTIASLLQRCVRLHLFANAAATTASNITSLPLASSYLSSAWTQVTSNIRTSVGAGVVIAAGPALRFELNYAIPLSFDRISDSPDSGFQFGFGVHFN